MRLFRLFRSGAALLLGLCGMAACYAVAADDYPTRPVTIIVSFTPGGSTDILARYEAEVLQRDLHGIYMVENRPGAGGEIGISYASRAVPTVIRVGQRVGLGLGERNQLGNRVHLRRVCMSQHSRSRSPNGSWRRNLSLRCFRVRWPASDGTCRSRFCRSNCLRHHGRLAS